MKIKFILFAIIIIAINETLFATTNDWVTAISSNNWTSVINITSTNITLKSSSSEKKFIVYMDNEGFYSPEHNETVIINTNKIISIFGNIGGGGTFKFTPVSFTNQLVGFRINHYVTLNTNRFWIDDYRSSTNTWYVVLSDTPMEVGEGDVERELDLSEPEEP